MSNSLGPNTYEVSNSLDPDQDLPSVGPDLGPNCLQRLSADDKSHQFCGKNVSCQPTSSLLLDLFECNDAFEPLLVEDLVSTPSLAAASSSLDSSTN